MSWFSGEISAVEAWFSSEEKAILNFLEGAAKAIVQAGGPVLLSAATAAVAAAEATGGSGSAKLTAAYNATVSVLKSQGVPVIENAVQAALQGAVANLNAAQAAVVAAAPMPSTPATPAA